VDLVVTVISFLGHFDEMFPINRDIFLSPNLFEEWVE
jgi:hypothetical protein